MSLRVPNKFSIWHNAIMTVDRHATLAMTIRED